MNEIGLGQQDKYSDFNNMVQKWLEDAVDEYLKHDNKLPLYINFITARGDLLQWGNKVMQSLSSKIGSVSKERLFFDYHMYGLYSNHGPDTMWCLYH